MFSIDAIYVQVFAKRFVVQNIDSGAVAEVSRGVRAPEILLHPMELIEGGITQVEHRLFVELGMGAGASKAAVFSGPPLSGDAVAGAIREYKS